MPDPNPTHPTRPPTAPTLSVALATCQGERFLQAQLDSLARQTLRPLELVVGDDASTDGTIAILDAFAKTAPFPVLVQQNPVRLGFRGNFFTTAERCRGDLIAFCDQDDVWRDNKLERCVAPFANPDVTMVCHDANIVDRDGSSLGQRLVSRPNGQWAWYRKPLHLEYGMSMVFRRWLNDCNDLWPRTAHVTETGTVERDTHDQWYYFLAAILGEVVDVDECLVDYRQHGSNVIGAFTRKVDRTPTSRSRYFNVRVQRLRNIIAMWPDLRARAAPAFQARMDAHLPAYQQALRLYEGRTAIYGDGGIGDRLGGMAKMAQAAGYSRDEFGPRGVLPDVMFGILRFTPGPRTTKLYAKLSGLVR